MVRDNNIESLTQKFKIMGEANEKELEKNCIINGGGPRINGQNSSLLR